VTCGSCGARLRRHERDNGLCDRCDALPEQPIQGHPKPEAAKHQVNDGLVQVDCSGSALSEGGGAARTGGVPGALTLGSNAALPRPGSRDTAPSESALRDGEAPETVAPSPALSLLALEQFAGFPLFPGSEDGCQ
jgi:hypothetical protein